MEKDSRSQGVKGSREMLNIKRGQGFKGSSEHRIDLEDSRAFQKGFEGHGKGFKDSRGQGFE